VLAVQVKDVPRDDAERQLDQRDGDAELDRDHRRDEDNRTEDRGKLNWAHADLRFRIGRSVEAISPEGG